MMFNKNNFKIYEFASKEENIRPEICGVLVKPNETIATNSFYLVKVGVFPTRENSENKNFKPFIVKRDRAKELTKITPELKSIDEVKRIVGSEIVEGEYPKINNFFNEEGKHIKIRVNAKFLSDIAKFIASTSADVDISVPLNGDKPLRFTASKNKEGQEIKAILMPIKNV